MIQSDNIRLRGVEPYDIDTIFIWENDPEIWHLGGTLLPFSRFDIEQYVMNATKDIFTMKQLRMMIDVHTEKDDYLTIGCIDLFDFDPFHKRAGLGILIDKKSRKNGYASQALDLIIEYSFNTLNLHQLFCNIESDNEMSLNLFKKKHFEIIGVKKDWNFKGGSWIDELMLQKINMG